MGTVRGGSTSVGSAQITDNSIVDADINSSAAIARSKLAALPASVAMVTDGSGNDTTSSTTATELGYVHGVTSAIQTQLNALPTFVPWTTYTPTVTLVGGSGNTVPTYTTNNGRYSQIGKVVFVDIYLTGNGGTAGAGTGQFTVALPVAASASHDTSLFNAGYADDNGANNNFNMFGQIAGNVSVVSIFREADTGYNIPAFTGADQAHATRIVRLKFHYEAA